MTVLEDALVGIVERASTNVKSQLEAEISELIRNRAGAILDVLTNKLVDKAGGLKKQLEEKLQDDERVMKYVQSYGVILKEVLKVLKTPRGGQDAKKGGMNGKTRRVLNSMTRTKKIYRRK
jgi:hypothetical protein